MTRTLEIRMAICATIALTLAAFVAPASGGVSPVGPAYVAQAGR